MVHTLSHVRYATQLRGCTNCAQGFLNSTKPSKLAIHGSISPCPGVHAGPFLYCMGIIQQYLGSFAIRPPEPVCACRLGSSRCGSIYLFVALPTAIAVGSLCARVCSGLAQHHIECHHEAEAHHKCYGGAV